MGFIYKITNLINNQMYIGQTIKSRPADRYSQHKYDATHLDKAKSVSYLHRAMNAYGIDNFKFEIIEEIDNELLSEREQYWISFYNTLIPNGYNMTIGGEGTQGFSRTQTQEEKAQRSTAQKEYYKAHPEAIENIRQRTTELWKNTEYREKVTQSNIKFYQEHPDMFKGENNPMYGKKHTEESLKKIRAHAATRKLQIAQLDKDTLEIIRIFDGVKDAEKALQVSHGWISKAAKNDKVAYGYRWKFL